MTEIEDEAYDLDWRLKIGDGRFNFLCSLMDLGDIADEKEVVASLG